MFQNLFDSEEQNIDFNIQTILKNYLLIKLLLYLY